MKIPGYISVSAFLASNDRQLVVTENRGCTFALYNIQSGIAEGRVDWCDPQSSDRQGIEMVDVSRDGRLMAVVFQGGRLMIWNVTTGQVILEVTIANAPLSDFSFHPDSVHYALLTRVSGRYSLTVWELAK